MKQDTFLTRIASLLDGACIPFMLVGSFSSSFHGPPRATNDVDLVIDPSAEQLDVWLSLLADRYYVSVAAAQAALKQRGMFNVIELSSGDKADLILRKDRPYSIEEFRRRRQGIIHGREMSIASAEDVILTKLEWNNITPSERQLQDALNVAIAQWPKLDQQYLRKWAPSLGVSDHLEQLLRAAAQAQQGKHEP